MNGEHDCVKTAEGEYPFVVERAEDGGLWAYFPDLPGCVTSAETSAELRRNAAEAAELYLSYYRDRGQMPPVPRRAVVG